MYDLLFDLCNLKVQYQNTLEFQAFIYILKSLINQYKTVLNL